MLQHWHPCIQRDAKESTAYKIMMISETVSGGGSINYPQPSVFPQAPAAPAPGLQKRLISQVIRIKVSLMVNGVPFSLCFFKTYYPSYVPNF